MHYQFNLQAPYDFVSLPKLLGVPGGILLTFGAGALAYLKTRAEKYLGNARVRGGEMAFVLIFGLAGLAGLVLYAATGKGAVGLLLAVHLGTVLALFLTLPYSKLVHGFYRFAALLRDAQTNRIRYTLTIVVTHEPKQKIAP
ncbi:hypothetical protein GCM10011517_00800 [Actibacterium pelagium]|uniref:Uncharacterized protein n=2 Tax=Actibacterium pelagium TaxID=2029103 RepID=A0A917AA39_9RHOB|nr:hypothetical protein [Actibacterium pelagium]GGE36940.1 hypothetical protein GCM10011517_00800 [Actibacterium pelagium]